jgi:hypothetical protein
MHKVRFVNLILRFLETNVIRYSYAFLSILANVFLGVGMPRSCAGWFPGGKGGTQMLAGLAP